MASVWKLSWMMKWQMSRWMRGYRILCGSRLRSRHCLRMILQMGNLLPLKSESSRRVLQLDLLCRQVLLLCVSSNGGKTKKTKRLPMTWRRTKELPPLWGRISNGRSMVRRILMWKEKEKPDSYFWKMQSIVWRLLLRKTKLILIIMSFQELMRQERHMRQMYWG